MKENFPGKNLWYQEKGFTLIEVVIAIAILSIGLLSIGIMQTAAMRGDAISRSISEASVKASGKLEALLNLPWAHADLTDRTVDGAAGLGDIGIADADGNMADGRYTLFWNIADNLAETNTKSVAVIVEWTDRGVRRHVVMQAVIPRRI